LDVSLLPGSTSLASFPPWLNKTRHALQQHRVPN
jgi:hypothetical protein